MDSFKRTASLIGKDNLEFLKNSHVAIFGIGGVGGFVLEALVRSGVGHITVIDNDVVQESNLNRQIIADCQSIGVKKTIVAEKRVKAINPDLEFFSYETFVLPENISEIDFTSFDYVIDAVDTVSAKLCIIKRAAELNKPVISCMGTGGKLDPLKIEITDISKTSVCPLARVMRRELKKFGIDKLKVAYSKEESKKALDEESAEKRASGRVAPPSMIFVPATAGIVIAAETVKDLLATPYKVTNQR